MFSFKLKDQLVWIYVIIFSNLTFVRQKKLCVFPVTRLILIFCSDPTSFYCLWGQNAIKWKLSLALTCCLWSVHHKIPHNPHLLPSFNCYSCYLDVKEAKLVGKNGRDFIKKKKIRPTNPDIFRHVTGNTHIFWGPYLTCWFSICLFLHGFSKCIPSWGYT